MWSIWYRFPGSIPHWRVINGAATSHLHSENNWYSLAERVHTQVFPIGRPKHRLGMMAGTAPTVYHSECLFSLSKFATGTRRWSSATQRAWCPPCLLFGQQSHVSVMFADCWLDIIYLHPQNHDDCKHIMHTLIRRNPHPYSADCLFLLGLFLLSQQTADPWYCWESVPVRRDGSRPRVIHASHVAPPGQWSRLRVL